MKRRVQKTKKHAVAAGGSLRSHAVSHIGSDYVKRKKHHKPYRFRHVGLLLVAFAICLSSALQLGVFIGRNLQQPSELANATHAQTTSVQTVRSSAGFSFSFDGNQFQVEAKELTNGVLRTLSENELHQDRLLKSVLVKPSLTYVDPQDAATRLSLGVGSQAPKSPVSDTNFSVTELSQTKEVVANVEFVKQTFQHAPKFGSLKSSVYSVYWTAKVGKNRLSIHLEGLVGDASIPVIYATIFNSLHLAESPSVLGVSIDLPFWTHVSAATKLNEKYLLDSVSPAVVKIYHVICGTIVYKDQVVSSDGCLGMSGTGFLISSDGHVATNGHVVVFNAEDAFIKLLAGNPSLFVGFLKQEVGLSDQEIKTLTKRPDLLSALIAEIYNLPGEFITFKNERRTYLVSLGDTPAQLETPKQLTQAHVFKETESILKARFLGADYAARDLYVINSGDKAGFSSSDVAILKINTSDAPTVRLAQDVTQGQKISIVGFPGDAENQLTDNSTLDVSVTNGTISSIRDAAGGKYKLFQSDADASRGNSGGPVFDENGDVLGLLTYRFKSESAVDAAKSYIRDAEDLRQLVQDKNIDLAGKSETQARWEHGLQLFSENRYSKAVKEFEAVTDLYPAHRLADTYIENAKKAIAEGRDVKDFPPILFGGLLTAGAIGMAAAVILIARHRGHHRSYQLAHAYAASGPAQPGNITASSPSAPIPESVHAPDSASSLDSLQVPVPTVTLTPKIITPAPPDNIKRPPLVQ